MNPIKKEKRMNEYKSVDCQKLKHLFYNKNNSQDQIIEKID